MSPEQLKLFCTIIGTESLWSKSGIEELLISILLGRITNIEDYR